MILTSMCFHFKVVLTSFPEFTISFNLDLSIAEAWLVLSVTDDPLSKAVRRRFRGLVLTSGLVSGEGEDNARSDREPTCHKLVRQSITFRL